MSTKTYQPLLSPPGCSNVCDAETFHVKAVFGTAFLESYEGKHIIAQRTAPGTLKLSLPRHYRRRTGFRWGWGKRGAGAVLIPVVSDDDSADSGVVTIEIRAAASGTPTDPADGDELDLELSFSMNVLNDKTLTPPAPIVSALDVVTDFEAGGAAVEITGENFSEGASVKFGATTAGAIVFVDENTITCTAPAHTAGVVAVSVINPDSQTGTKAAAFTYTVDPGP